MNSRNYAEISTQAITYQCECNLSFPLILAKGYSIIDITIAEN